MYKESRLRKRSTIFLVVTLLLTFSLLETAAVFAAAPATPVITTLPQSTTTNPIILTGTAEANADIMVAGGASTGSTTATAGGNWSLSVTLTPNMTNNLSVIASNTDGTSSPALVAIIHDSSTTDPAISTPAPVCSTSSPITLSGTAEAGATITITGGSSTATTTANGSGSWSTTVNLASSTATTLYVTATDALGNVSSTSTVSAMFDNTAPQVTLNGNSEMSVVKGSTFVDPGLTIIDTDINATSSTTGSVNTNDENYYTLTYTVRDCAGNVTTLTRTVRVINGGSSNQGGGRSSFNPSATAIAQVAANIPFPAQISNPVFQLSQSGQVLGAATFHFTRGLKKGHRGNDVAELQLHLKNLGFFKGNVTGYFGNLTAAAVSAFQRSVGLPAVGQVGPRTLQVLNNS